MMAPEHVPNQGTPAVAASWTQVRFLTLAGGVWLAKQFALLFKAWKVMKYLTNRWQLWLLKSAWADWALQHSVANGVPVPYRGCQYTLLMWTL